MRSGVCVCECVIRPILSPQLEILTSLANEANISTILREFQVSLSLFDSLCYIRSLSLSMILSVTFCLSLSPYTISRSVTGSSSTYIITF